METIVKNSERPVNEITADLKKNANVNKDKKPAKSESQKLIDEIKKMDIADLTKKTTGNKALYKLDAKLKYGNNNQKTGRRIIRNIGISKSFALLSAIITGQKIADCKKDLKDFYNEVLLNFDNFADERKDKDIFAKLKKAHDYLRLNK